MNYKQEFDREMDKIGTPKYLWGGILIIVAALYINTRYLLHLFPWILLDYIPGLVLGIIGIFKDEKHE